MALNNGLFSESIEKVIKNASKIALRFGSNLVGTEHLLYGLASVKDCTASKLLEMEGASEQALFNILQDSANGVSLFGTVELTPRSKELFQIAQGLAMDMNHSFIGTEHLLLAILNKKDCYATKMLVNIFNINISELKQKVLSALNVAKENKKSDDSQAGSALPEKLLEMGFR